MYAPAPALHYAAAPSLQLYLRSWPLGLLTNLRRGRQASLSQLLNEQGPVCAQLQYEPR